MKSDNKETSSCKKNERCEEGIEIVFESIGSENTGIKRKKNVTFANNSDYFKCKRRKIYRPPMILGSNTLLKSLQWHGNEPQELKPVKKKSTHEEVHYQFSRKSKKENATSMKKEKNNRQLQTLDNEATKK